MTAAEKLANLNARIEELETQATRASANSVTVTRAQRDALALDATGEKPLTPADRDKIRKATQAAAAEASELDGQLAHLRELLVDVELEAHAERATLLDAQAGQIAAEGDAAFTEASTAWVTFNRSLSAIEDANRRFRETSQLIDKARDLAGPKAPSRASAFPVRIDRIKAIVTERMTRASSTEATQSLADARN